MTFRRLLLVLSVFIFASFALPVKASDDADPNKPSPMFASQLTTDIKIYGGVYDFDQEKHIIGEKIEIQELKSWIKFAAQIDKLKTVTSDIDIGMILSQDFIKIEERDKDGKLTQTTLFTPGFIQQTVYEIHFYERRNKSRQLFLDLLEMQMNDASFGDNLGRKVPINTEGIVIHYDISNTLHNPQWVVQDADMIKILLDTLNIEGEYFFPLTYSKKSFKEQIDSTLETEIDVFKIYINLGMDNLPYKYFIAPRYMFGLKRSHNTRIMVDEQGYYEFFQQFYMNQVENSLKE